MHPNKNEARARAACMRRDDDSYRPVIFASRSPLCNGFPSPFLWRCAQDPEPVRFACAEQALAYACARRFGDDDAAAEALKTADPSALSRLGTETCRANVRIWLTEAPGVAEDLLYAKFSQSPVLRAALLATGQRPLVRAVPWDRLWGIGLDARFAQVIPPQHWPGLNLLGSALEAVRRRLVAEGSVC